MERPKMGPKQDAKARSPSTVKGLPGVLFLPYFYPRAFKSSSVSPKLFCI